MVQGSSRRRGPVRLPHRLLSTHLIVYRNDPSLSPSVYVIEMWLELLGEPVYPCTRHILIFVSSERAKIPCHDNLGRRHIQWIYVPTFLARGNLCIIGCPKECIPRVERDVVVEASSPYFYDGLQVGLMYRAFMEKRVSIGIRPQGMWHVCCG